MAHNVSNEYKQAIYSGDARNKLKLSFNNVELENPDLYCEKLTIKSRIISNGSKSFSLNNFISKEAELILHSVDLSLIQDQVSISIGTLVGNSYEYVPIGIFNIQNQPTTDKDRTTIQLRDNSVKFDFNYNAQPLIEENGGSATKLQILQDICTQAGVTCNITSFIGYLDEIGIYDNTVTARQYIADIAEQAGKIPTINRSGELIFIDLNNLTTWEIPINIVEKYENGTKFKIGRVVYEDGIVRYETPTSTDDTLFLDGSNNYINGELVKEQANSSDNSYYLEDTGESELAYFELEGKTTQETRSGKNLLPNNAVNGTINGITLVVNEDGSMTFNGTASAFTRFYILSINSSIPINAGTYTLSVEKSGTTSAGDIYMNINFTSLGLQYFYVPNVTYKNITLSSNDTIANASITFAQGVSLTNFTIKPQLEAGSTQTSYEQYGVMPSPEFPSELVSVGYENLIKIKDNLATSTIGLTYTYNEQDNTLNINGTPTRSYETFILNREVNLEAGNYIFFIDKALPFRVVLYHTFEDNTTDTITMTPGMTSVVRNFTKKVISFRIGATVMTTGTAIDETFKIQFEKGTQQHSYIPYGKYGIEVKTTGKNLFDEIYPSIATSVKYKAIYVGEGTFTMSTTMPYASTYTNLFFLSGNVSSGVSTGTNGVWNERSRTITSTNGYITVGYRVADNISPINYNTQIEKSTTVTDYEEYKSNTYLYTLDEPLRSIGDTKDLLYIKNGMLYVDRKIGKILLNGSENWRDFFSTPGIIVVNLLNCVNSPSTINCMSNYFANTYSRAYIRTHLDSVDKVCATNGEELILANKNITSVNDFKTWLSTHNTEVNYLLATPSLEELGEVELPLTYDNVTIIDLYSRINTNSYIQYRQPTTQLQAILNEVNEFDIDSLETGKILGNPAIDPYDLIQIHDKSRNLLNNQKPSQTISGVNFVVNDDGSIIANGTATAGLNFYLNTGYITLQAGTYCISDNTPNPNDSTYFTFVDSLNIGTRAGQKYKTISEATNCQVRIVIRNGVTLNNVVFKVQLEEGIVPTEYQPYRDETYTTLATNDLVYNGVMINTFDTQIGEEEKEQNVSILGEATFKKWAKTSINNIEGSITLQAGQIDEANGRINETNLTIEKDGALLSVLANNSNIDIEYDGDTPISGEVREVTTTTGFKFNAEGMTISDDSSNFYALHRNTGTYYYDGGVDPTKIVGQYTKDGSKQKDLVLFGVYYYGMEEITDTPMFVTELYNDENGEECVGHFYNRGD